MSYYDDEFKWVYGMGTIWDLARKAGYEIHRFRTENERLREALEGMIDLAEAANVMDDPAYGAARKVLETGE